MLYFGRKLDIFGDVSTHGHNWAKMRNKEKNPHTKDGAERGQKEPKPAGLEPFRPAGLARSEAQSASIFFSAKYSEKGGSERKYPETIYRDPFELDTRER